MKKNIRLIVQAMSLSLFIWLFYRASFPFVETFLPVDFFLRLDPLVGVFVPLVSREWISSLLPALCVLVSAFIVGRIFCGYICPMGITLDIARFFIPKKKLSTENKLFFEKWEGAFRKIKYVFLALIFGSALLGVNHIFWGSPIALITRFYTIIVYPVIVFFSRIGLDIARPTFEMFNNYTLSYIQILPRVFYSVLFVAVFFGLLFFLERVRPRFWCRYLCPAGALLSLFSFNPLWKKRVNSCTKCNKCVKSCPTGAISSQTIGTQKAECIACLECENICPANGVHFSFNKKYESQDLIEENKSEKNYFLSRRSFLYSSTLGASIALLGKINAASFLLSSKKSTVEQAVCVRPPAALPEVEFLEKCIRCGECMKVCPTNGLQPAYFVSGMEGLFSPVLVSRIGGCEPECNLCGKVCPTGAIMSLSLEEKEQAKIGTAVVQKNICLAWEEGKACVVCQEVCPYGAIELITGENPHCPVPVVNVRRCFGCGFCEHHCPVKIPAIIIQPLNALRLNIPNYKEVAQSADLDLIPVSKRPMDYVIPIEIKEGELPPGFSD